MGPYRVGHGELVSPVGRLRPTDPGHGRHADRAGRRSHPAATALSHGWVEGRYRGAAPGRGGRVSAAAAWNRGPQAEAPTRGAKDAVLRPSGQGPQHGWPGRGGYPTRGLRWSASLCQAVTSPATRHDDPDGFHGTMVWDAAGARRTPAAPHPVSVVEPLAPPGEDLAPRQPLQLCDAPQEPAPRAHPAYPGDGHRADRPCLELSGVCLAASAYRPSPHQAEG